MFSCFYPGSFFQDEVTNKLADEKQPQDRGIVHYEGGIPVFDIRLNKLEDEAREAKSRDEEYKKQQLKLNKRLVWFTGVLAFVGVVGGAISGYQAHVAKINAAAARDNASAAKGMVEEMKRTRLQAELDSAKALSTQQQVAQDSLTKSQNNFERSSREAQESFRADQRAWVGVSGAELTQFEAGKPLHLDVALLNTGKTPAHKTRECTGYVLSRVYLKEPPSEAVAQCETTWKPSHDLPPQGRFLSRAGEAYIGASPIDQGNAVYLSQSYDAIKGKVQILYIFGEYEYRDLTGRTRDTRYCLYLANPDTKTVQFCDGFNNMD